MYSAFVLRDVHVDKSQTACCPCPRS